jgi:hypothetical protein
MSDEKTIFTLEQIAEQAQGNATALTLVTIAYLRDHDLAADEYVAYVGRRFAPGWAEMQGRPAKDIAQAAALNMVSVGGTLQSLSGDDSQAQAVIRDWPSADWRTYFALDQVDIDPIWNMFRSIAESLGFQYEWTRQGDEVTMTFSR